MAARHCFAIFVASLLIVSGCDSAKVASNTDAAANTSADASSTEPSAKEATPDFPELKVTPTGNVGTSVGDTAPDIDCLLYTSPSPRDATLSRMPSSA